MALKSIPIDLDRPRTWKFSANATIAFYRALGKDAFRRLEVFQALENETPDEMRNRSMETLGECLEVFVALLWCGLLGEDPNLSLAAVGEMIGPGRMTDLLPALLEAVGEGMTANPTQAPPATDRAVLTASG